MSISLIKGINHFIKLWPIKFDIFVVNSQIHSTRYFNPRKKKEDKNVKLKFTETNKILFFGNYLQFCEKLLSNIYGLKWMLKLSCHRKFFRDKNKFY